MGAPTEYLAVIVDVSGPERPAVYGPFPNEGAVQEFFAAARESGELNEEEEGYAAHLSWLIHPTPTTADVVEVDGETFVRLPSGEMHDPEDGWCTGCELLDPKPWRFTREAAAVMTWVVCPECAETFRDGLDDDPMFMDEVL